MAAIGSQLYNKLFIKEKYGFKNMIYFLMILSFSVAGIAIFKSNAFIVFIFIQQIVRGITVPFFNIETNAYVRKDTKLRTTDISIKSLISTLIVSSSLFLTGIANKSFSITDSIILFSVSVIIILLCLCVINNWARKKGKVIKYVID